MPYSAKKPKTARKTKPSRDKVRAHRERLRALGLRPIQIWVPDTRRPAFAVEARRQSRLVAGAGDAAMDQTFVDAIAVELDG
jgi:Protein  of unknown function (DUF3018)